MTSSAGAVTGVVKTVLRTEGVVVFIISLLLFAETERSWWLFAALILSPDVAILAYLVNARIGAFAYNCLHSYIGPLALAFVTRGDGLGYAIALIWVAHCGMDRAGGYGLKYSSAFGDTHLGRVGRAA